MASKKKSSSKPKTKSKSRTKPRAAATEQREAVDTGVRQLVPKSVVENLAVEQKKCLARAGTASQDFSTEMKKAQERGLNPVAFRLATRLTRMAERDPAKALVCWEDTQFYLLECLGFDRMTTKVMFPASETRSGKKSSTRAKKNGGAPVQTDIEEAAPTSEPEVLGGPGGNVEEQEAASEAVH